MTRSSTSRKFGKRGGWRHFTEMTILPFHTRLHSVFPSIVPSIISSIIPSIVPCIVLPFWFHYVIQWQHSVKIHSNFWYHKLLWSSLAPIGGKINQCHFGDLRVLVTVVAKIYNDFQAGHKNNQCHGTWDWLEWRPWWSWNTRCCDCKGANGTITILLF